MHSNISQILLLYETWRYYNKFDSTKSLGVRYRCVKIPQCGKMEHGLRYIAFYVQKHITPGTVVITSLLFRDKLQEAPASVKRVYLNDVTYSIVGLSQAAIRWKQMRTHAPKRREYMLFKIKWEQIGSREARFMFSFCAGAVVWPLLPDRDTFRRCGCPCLCPYVCVCLCVCQPLLVVHAITHHPFKLGSPNLDQKMQNILLEVHNVWGLIELNLPGQI